MSKIEVNIDKSGQKVKIMDVDDQRDGEVANFKDLPELLWDFVMERHNENNMFGIDSAGYVYDVEGEYVSPEDIEDQMVYTKTGEL